MPDENYLHIDSARNNESSRSKTINEILADSPGFLVKYGLQLFLCIFLSLFTILFFVQLPETIIAEIKIQNEPIVETNQLQSVVEITVPFKYKKDIHAGTEILIKFSDDSTKINNQLSAIVTNVSANTSNEKFVIKAKLPVSTILYKPVDENHLIQAKISYNLRLFQHVYRNITPGT